MTLAQLRPGSTFIAAGIHRPGKLLRRTSCAAVVIWTGAPILRTITTHNAAGELVTRTIKASPAEEYIATGTELEVPS
jgi:hypothetical protein